jgi:hypothetical protein
MAPDGGVYVVRGNPTDDEAAAAVIAVRTALAAAARMRRAQGCGDRQWPGRSGRITAAPAERGTAAWRWSGRR